MPKVTVRVELEIARAPEAVFDFTQDWSRRTRWDPSVRGVEVLPGEARAFRVRASGGLRFIARYKLFDRPRRTSLGMFDLRPGFVSGGGGSWEYEATPGGTMFRQTNTLVLPRWMAPWAWLFRAQLEKATRAAMENAKRMMEAE